MWCTQGAIMEISISVAVLQSFFTLEVIQQHSLELKHTDRRSLRSFLSAEACKHLPQCCKVRRLSFTLSYVSRSAPGDFWLCIKWHCAITKTGLAPTQKILYVLFFFIFIFFCAEIWMWWLMHSVQEWQKKIQLIKLGHFYTTQIIEGKLDKKVFTVIFRNCGC